MRLIKKLGEKGLVFHGEWILLAAALVILIMIGIVIPLCY